MGWKENRLSENKKKGLKIDSGVTYMPLGTSRFGVAAGRKTKPRMKTHRSKELLKDCSPRSYPHTHLDEK